MASKAPISLQVVPATLQREIKRMRRLNDHFAEQLPKLVAETGLAIQLDAKREVPVEYGFLRASIYFDHRGNTIQPKSGTTNTGRKTGRVINKQVSIPFHRSETTREGLTAFVGSEMSYAMKIEFDHKPYLFPAYEKHAPRFERAIRNLIREAVKK